MALLRCLAENVTHAGDVGAGHAKRLPDFVHRRLNHPISHHHSNRISATVGAFSSLVMAFAMAPPFSFLNQ